MDQDSAHRLIDTAGRGPASLGGARGRAEPRLGHHEGLALVALTGPLYSWPVPKTEIDRREDEIARGPGRGFVAACVRLSPWADEAIDLESRSTTRRMPRMGRRGDDQSAKPNE